MRITSPRRALRPLVPLLILMLPAPPVRADEAGRALYLRHCVRCHGATASTGIGGDIRGLHQRTVEHALRGVEAMPRFDLGEAEVAALVAYLAALDEV